ncbi:MAG: hypothetical protein HZA17_12855, partial [Nitrospirae bacterium]|nr:hypothetical protein [Nitrospirota bacterium]
MKRVLSLLLAVILLSCSVSAYAFDIRRLADIPFTDGLTAIAVKQGTGVAAAVSSWTRTLYLIDMVTDKVVSVPLDAMPSGIVIDETGNLAVVSSKEGSLYIFDLKTGKLSHTIVTDSAIFALAIDKHKSRLYLSSDPGLMVLDLKTEAVINEASLSDRVISLDIDGTLGYLTVVMDGKDSIFLYDAETLTLTAEIKTGRIPSGVAVNPSTHIAVLTNDKDNSIAVISLEDRRLLDVLPLYERPSAVSIDPINNIALIANTQGIGRVRLENPMPRITSLIPKASRLGDPGFMLSIEGTRFVRDTQTQFNRKDVATYFNTNERLQARISSEDLTATGDVPVTVTSPAPGGGISNALTFRVYNPAPVLEEVYPAIVALDSAPAIRVRGRNFFNGSIININGENLRTRFISSILLEAEMKQSDTKNKGQYPVVVMNPAPGSFTSNPKVLTVVDENDPKLRQLQGATRNMEAAEGTGSLRGRIVNTHLVPLEKVTIRIRNLRAETGADGYFLLENIPAGKHVLLMDGSTEMKRDGHYPTIPIHVNIQAGIVNAMPFKVYLHKQKARNFKHINPGEDTVLQDPEVPGFEMRIPKGVKITGWDGRPNLKVSVRTVPTDRLPVKPLPDNSFVRTVYMFYFDKIGGGTPDQPIPVKAPNDLGLLPGAKAILWYYDESPNDGEAPNDWAIAGTGTVTPDGKYIVSDPGVGIPKFCCGATAWGGSGGSGDCGGGDGGCDGGGCCGASGGPGGPGGGPGGGGGGSDGPHTSGTAGDPVDLATGRFIHAKQDLYLPGAVPVKIARYYRSGDTNLGAFGRSTYFEYDWWLGDYGDMLLLIKPGNYRYSFARQTDGTYLNATDPAMAGAVVTYNAEDDTRTLKMKDGSKYKFIYRDRYSGELIEMEDRNGNKLTISRKSRVSYGDDEGGYITHITNAEGKTVTFNLTYIGGFFRTDSITDSAGRTVTYAYETDPFSTYPRLKTVTYPDGSTIQYEYDSAGRMSGMVNERGMLEVLNEYDANNRVIRQTHADGGVFLFDYTVAGGYVTETRMTSPNGALTTWRFNNYKYITDKTTPDGTATYEREPGTNKILSVTDPLGRRMTYTYDTKGRVTAVADNAQNTTTYEYEDTFSNVTRATNALGQITTMTYDAVGNMLTTTGPDNKTTTFTYNTVGKPLTVTDNLGHTSTMEYDTSDNLIRVTDPLGNFSTMEYDSLSRMIKMTDAKGKSTYYNYDIMGRTKEVTDPLGDLTKYSYDADGKLAIVIDAKNH